MVDPLSAVAGAVTTYILPEALKKVGGKIGEAALEKSEAALIAARKTVLAKLQAAGTAGLLTRAEAQPTQANVQVLQAEIVSQMEADQRFAAQLQELVNQIQSQSPTLQVILDELRVEGKLEMGNVQQVNEGQGSTQQVIGRNWQVEGDAKIGDISQENRGGK
jgi:predicted RNA-binding protein Jag